MSAPLALLLACGIIAVLVVVLIFAIAAWVVQRRISGGPYAAAAQGLAVGLMLVMGIAVAAVVWGICSGWA